MFSEFICYCKTNLLIKGISGVHKQYPKYLTCVFSEIIVIILTLYISFVIYLSVKNEENVIFNIKTNTT